MAVLVYGVGAIGGLLATLLSRNEEVHAVARDDTVRAVREEGIGVVTEGATIKGEFQIWASLLEIPRETRGNIDTVFVTTKAYDAVSAVEDIRAHLGPDTVVLFMNGMGIEEELPEGEFTLLRAASGLGAYREAPGVINWTGHGTTFIGVVRGDAGNLDNTVEMLATAGVRVVPDDDIRRRVWLKTAANAVVNPITAITGLRNGAILEDDGLKTLARQVAEEAHAVMSYEYPDIELSEVWDFVVAIIEATAGNSSSMLMDIRNGKRTEIDFINGYIEKKGSEYGIRTPVNLTLRTLLIAISRERGAQRRVNSAPR